MFCLHCCSSFAVHLLTKGWEMNWNWAVLEDFVSIADSVGAFFFIFLKSWYPQKLIVCMENVYPRYLIPLEKVKYKAIQVNLTCWRYSITVFLSLNNPQFQIPVLKCSNFQLNFLKIVFVNEPQCIYQDIDILCRPSITHGIREETAFLL